MPHLVVCSLFDLEATARAHGAREMVTLLSDANRVERPDSVDPARHLVLGMNDIAAPRQGLDVPEASHVGDLISFAREWDRSAPLLIHCWMGVSRSTAAAYIVASALNPALNEEDLAQELRRRSPTATPNPRLVTLADRLLERNGRMIAAIEQIGRGADTSYGVPFLLPLEVD